MHFYLILPSDLLLCHKRITDQIFTFQIFMVHIHSGNLAVLISRVIIDSFVHIAAGAVYRNLVLTFTQADTALLLRHRTQDMKELTDTLRF